MHLSDNFFYLFLFFSSIQIGILHFKFTVWEILGYLNDIAIMWHSDSYMHYFSLWKWMFALYMAFSSNSSERSRRIIACDLSTFWHGGFHSSVPPASHSHLLFIHIFPPLSSTATTPPSNISISQPPSLILLSVPHLFFAFLCHVACSCSQHSDDAPTHHYHAIWMN